MTNVPDRPSGLDWEELMSLLDLAEWVTDPDGRESRSAELADATADIPDWQLTASRREAEERGLAIDVDPDGTYLVQRRAAEGKE